jgi:hypothetical protein
MNNSWNHFFYLADIIFLGGDFFDIFFTTGGGVDDDGEDDFLTEGEDIGVVFFLGKKKSGIGSDFILL